MKNLLKSMALGVGVFSMLALASCSNEESVTNPEPNKPFDGTITLYLPAGSAEYVTKASDDYNAGKDLAAEAKLNDLWFYAFPYTDKDNADTGRDPIRVQLTPTKDNNFGPQSSTDQKYSDAYQVTGIKEGKYKIYVLANVEDYKGQNVNLTSLNEEAVKGLTLNFSTDKYIAPGNLPMAAMPTAIKNAKTENAVTDGLYEITGNDNEIYADLKLLCAKVRYTILFDQYIANTNESGFSKFYTYNVDFTTGDNSVKAGNVNNSTKITATSDFTAITGDITSKLQQVDYPGANSQYLKTKTDAYEADLEALKTAGQWTYDYQRAWQGIIYLTENKSTTQTKLTFTKATSVTGDEMKNFYEVSLFSGDRDLLLERGNFYDIICKMITPASFYYDVNVFVRVNPWDYVGTTPVEWK